MNTKQMLNAGFGFSRLAFGAVCTAAPERIGTSWIGDKAEQPQTKVILRALGVRDMVVGAGTLQAALSDDATPWIAASTLADLGDITATLLGRGALPDRAVKITVAVAGAAAITGLALLALEANED